MDISIPYYEDKTRISNSNIGWFLNKGPAYLHKMLTEDVPEEKNPVLERGTMIHEYILQPEEFQKDYVVWDKSRPSSAQQEKFCQALASSVEIEPDKAVLSAYKEAYSTAGKSDDKMLSEGLKIVSTLKDYIDFLKLNNGRLMISPSEAKMLEKIKQNVKNHKLACKLLWHNLLPNFSEGTTYSKGEITSPIGTEIIEKWWHEFHINWEYSTLYKVDIGQNETEKGLYEIQCKSLLDSLTLDFKNKVYTIMDLKTTAKLWHFEDSIEMYDYCRQLMYYTMAVEWYLENELHENPDDWTGKWYIIGIDTTGSNEIRVFEIEERDIYNRLLIVENALNLIAWHQMNDKWEHSREYYEGDGSETLNL